MSSVYSKNRWGLQRTGQLCSNILNDKLSKALQYVVGSSIYDAELTLRELTTSQSLLLSLLYGLLQEDITFCLNLIEASSAAVQLNSTYIKVWLKDDFIFKEDDVAKAFSNLAKWMDCKFPSQLKLPQNIAVAFSGLVDKYRLFEVFNLSGDKKALEFIKALNSFVLGLSNEVETTPAKENNTPQGSEVVKHDVESEIKTSGSSKAEENTKGSPNSAADHQDVVSGLPNSINDDEASPSSAAEPEVKSDTCGPPTLKFRPRPVASPVIEVEDGASGSSSHEPSPPISTPEVGNEASSSGSFSGESVPSISVKKVESQTCGLSPIKFRPRPMASPVIKVEDGASGSSSHEPSRPISTPEVGNEASSSGSFSGESVPSNSVNKDDIKSCLELAVRHNDHTTINFLLDSGLNVNEETESGQRLLHLAVYSGCVKTVSLLLALGALPELKNKDSITPLQLAVQLNTPTIIELLLRNGADVNKIFSDGDSPLHKTASTGALQTLNTLLRFKSAVDLQNSDGYTPLHLATKHGHLLAMQTLIKAGAAVNILSKEKESCLHISVENGNIGAIVILMRANANPYLKQKSGLNSFHLAHNINILNFFVNQNVSVDTRTSKGDTLLHLVAFKGYTELAERLIELHAMVNATNNEYNTPLMKAIEGGHSAMVRLLINSGAHVNYVNHRTKDAAIHLAAETGKIDCVRLLLDAGVDVNMKGGKRWAPIHNAAQCGYPSIVSLLIDKGADVNLRTDDNDTPLHWAAYNGCQQVAEILINNGADINAKGDFGHTPLKVATVRKKKSIINLLEERGAIF